MGIIVLENPEYCKVGLNSRQEGRQKVRLQGVVLLHWLYTCPKRDCCSFDLVNLRRLRSESRIKKIILHIQNDI